MVEGISELGEGVLLGERYRLVHRLDVFSLGAERVAGVDYEYWTALDVASEAEVWIQFASAGGMHAGGASLAGAVTALRGINHPAVPVVFAFGEYEFEHDGLVASVGYCAVPASDGETLATMLLRDELDDRSEVLAALAQVAETLELLAEFELVHGHLSAHSVLLTATEGAGYEVVLADLPASLALEATLDSELSGAADVYALAWLTVLSLIGPATLEAEFGAGFAVTAEPEPLAGHLVERRRAWAAENLVALGVSEALAKVLLSALGETAGRPQAAELTAALRAEWMELATGEATGAEEAAVADEAASNDVASNEAVSGEVEEIVAADVAEEVAAAEVAGTGAAAGSGTVAAAAATEVIPEASGGAERADPEVGRSGAGAGAGYAASNSGGYGGAGSGSSGAGSAAGQRTPRPRPKPGLLVAAGIGLAVVVVLIIVFSSSSSNKASAASASGLATQTAGARKSSAMGSGASSSASSGAAAGSSTAVVSGSGSGSGSGNASGSATFPATLVSIPASASEAVQEIRSVVSQARGELTGTEQNRLSQIVGTLSEEASAGQSISTGLSEFWALLHSGELPTSFNNYLEQYAMYLSASQGS